MFVSTWDLVAGTLGLGRGRSSESRYADISAERGRYARAFAGYAPYLGAHGHPAPLRSGADARRLYGQLSAARAGRLAEVTALLAREGVSAVPLPDRRRSATRCARSRPGRRPRALPPPSWRRGCSATSISRATCRPARR